MNLGEGLLAGLLGGAKGFGAEVSEMGKEAMQNEASLARQKQAEEGRLNTARTIEQMKQEAQKNRALRVAEINKSVKTTVDDPTHPEGARPRTARELATARAEAAEAAGETDLAKFHRDTENKIRDDEDRKEQKANEARMREEDLKDRARHRAVQEGLLGEAQAERKRKASREDDISGATAGYYAARRAGSEEAMNIYADMVRAKGGSLPGDTEGRQRYRHVEEEYIDPETLVKTKRYFRLDTHTGEKLPMEDVPTARKPGAKDEPAKPGGAAKWDSKTGDVTIDGRKVGNAKSKEDAKALAAKARGQ